MGYTRKDEHGRIRTTKSYDEYVKTRGQVDFDLVKDKVDGFHEWTPSSPKPMLGEDFDPR